MNGGDKRGKSGGATKDASSMDVFLRALTEHYAQDVTAPGVVVAWLPDQAVYYCSVRRYASTAFALHGNVVVKYRSRASAEDAVRGAMRRWRDEIRRPRQSHLALFMDADLRPRGSFDGD